MKDKLISISSLVFLLTCIIFSCTKSTSETSSLEEKQILLSRVYYSNGELKEVGTLIDSLKQGYWITYDTNKILLCECVYINNSLNGPFILYYFNGNVKVKGYMVAGNWKNERTFYYSNGKVKNRGRYLNGELHGVWDYYDVNGNLDKKIRYKNGLKEKILIDNKLIPSFPK